MKVNNYENKFQKFFVKENNFNLSNDTKIKPDKKIKEIFDEGNIDYKCRSSNEDKIEILAKISSNKSNIFSLDNKGNEVINTIIYQQSEYFFQNLYIKKIKEGIQTVFASRNIDENEIICNVDGEIKYEKVTPKKKTNIKKMIIETYYGHSLKQKVKIITE